MVIYASSASDFTDSSLTGKMFKNFINKLDASEHISTFGNYI